MILLDTMINMMQFMFIDHFRPRPAPGTSAEQEQIMYLFNPVALAAPALATAQALREQGDTPAAVLRVEGANVAVAVAVGTADLATGQAASPDMRFEVGSQTKVMTAVIVLQLVAEGRLALDDLLADHLPAEMLAGIEHADTATIRSALAMTSGIQSYTELVGEDGSKPFVDLVLGNLASGTTTADSLNLIRGVASTATPGVFDYSNTNYALLGELIAAVTGQPLAEVFEQRVFARAGMTGADLEGIVKSGDGLHGYTVFDDAGLMDTTFLPLDAGAEGGAVATTADLIGFFGALLTGDSLLDAQSLALMDAQVPIAEGEGVRQTFGLGLTAFEFAGGARFVGFSGATAGHVSATYRDAASGLIASTAANQAETAANPDFAAISLLQSLADDPAWAPLGDFDPRHDFVRVEQASAAEAALGDGLALTIGAATLTLPIDLAKVTDRNIRFDDGSVLIVGDNRVGTAGDDRGNLINLARQFSGAIDRDNQVLGLGGDDVIRAAQGDDRLSGGDGRDHLWGEGGADRIDGGAGDDWLSGDLGADLLTGGLGADVFNFDTVREIGRLRGARDVILDWEAGDTIDLAGIDARIDQTGDQVFHLVDAFTGQAGELQISGLTRLGLTYVEGDVTGDGRADFRIELTGVHALDTFDFVL